MKKTLAFTVLCVSLVGATSCRDKTVTTSGDFGEKVAMIEEVPETTTDSAQVMDYEICSVEDLQKVLDDHGPGKIQRIASHFEGQGISIRISITKRGGQKLFNYKRIDSSIPGPGGRNIQKLTAEQMVTSITIRGSYITPISTSGKCQEGVIDGILYGQGIIIPAKYE